MIFSLFDFSYYAHRETFAFCKYPWEILNLLQHGEFWSSLGRCREYAHALSFQNIKEHSAYSSSIYLERSEWIFVGKGTIIESGAFIRGPCILGEECTIRHGAYIRGNVIVGNQCVIGHDTEVKNSLFLDRAHAAHFAYVGDSILGNGTNLGAGFRCANVRLDRSVIYSQIDNRGTRLSTERKKIGAFLGDGVQTGCNGVSNPGTIVEKNTCIPPLLNIGGYIASSQRFPSHVQVSRMVD